MDCVWFESDGIIIVAADTDFSFRQLEDPPPKKRRWATSFMHGIQSKLLLGCSINKCGKNKSKTPRCDLAVREHDTDFTSIQNRFTTL